MSSASNGGREPDAVTFLTEELNDLRRAGNELAEAAHRVSAEFDGVHRLRLALAGWYKALANEGGRERIHGELTALLEESE